MMIPIVFAEILHYVFGVLMTGTAIFLILLVLVQRGKGGGLAGAFGGMGGQSAFGTKAGDTFTRITIIAATFWILLCIAAVKMLSAPAWAAKSGETNTTTSQDAGDDAPGSSGMGAGVADPANGADPTNGAGTDDAGDSGAEGSSDE